MNINQATTPLRMIFWGALLCVIDFSIGNFDLLNDFVGMILITIAVKKLGKFQVDSTYRGQMFFAFICCLIGCVEAFLGHFTSLGFLSDGASVVYLVGTVLFATAMSSLALSHGLDESASNWLTTRMLMIIFWCVPIGLKNLLAIASAVTGGSFIILPFALLLISSMLLMLIPLVHLFISTSKMRVESEVSGGAMLTEDQKKPY